MEIFRNKVGFIKYIKSFAQNGLIIGGFITLILLIYELLGGEASFVIGGNNFTGLLAALMTVIFVPMYIALLWMVIGVISYGISMFINWLLSLSKRS